MNGAAVHVIPLLLVRAPFRAWRRYPIPTPGRHRRVVPSLSSGPMTCVIPRMGEVGGVRGADACQVRHTHASWLIDAGENPKAVMHQLGQADLRTTTRYVHVLEETGVSRQAVRRAAAAAVPIGCRGGPRPVSTGVAFLPRSLSHR
jgi:integrase